MVDIADGGCRSYPLAASINGASDGHFVAPKATGTAPLAVAPLPPVAAPGQARSQEFGKLRLNPDQPVWRRPGLLMLICRCALTSASTLAIGMYLSAHGPEQGPAIPLDCQFFLHSRGAGCYSGLATAAVLRRLGLIVLEEDAEAGVLTLSPDEISRWSRSSHNRRGPGPSSCRPTSNSLAAQTRSASVKPS